jgi:hypothetical protein
MKQRIKDFFHNLWVRKLAVLGMILMFVVPLGIGIYFGFKAEETPKGEMWAMVIAIVILASISTFLKKFLTDLTRGWKKFIFGVKYILTLFIAYWLMLAISKVFSNGLGFILLIIQIIGVGIMLWLLDEFINKEYIDDRLVDDEALHLAKVEVKKEEHIEKLKQHS